MNTAKRVIVFTGDEDPMWPFLLEACSAEERSRIVLFSTNQPREANCSYRPLENSVRFSIGSEVIEGEDIQSVWLRRSVPPTLDHFSQELRQYCETEYGDFFEGIQFAMQDALWVSQPSAIARARNKALQLRLAQDVGFRVLPTMFTNSPDDLTAYIREGPTIYKSIRSPRVPMDENMNSTVFTTMLDDKMDVDRSGIMSCPGILQKFCKKESDIRISVFGEKLFAVRIESQTKELSRVDFRRGAKHLRHTHHELPEAVHDLCLALVKRLNLKYGAIDLALLDDGSYVFFEINPNGQWGWIEQQLGIPMRRALLDMLFLK